MAELPFKVDQAAEARSFLSGYRGAWFRCKIQDIKWRKQELGYALEYPDYPGEKIRWTKIYQKSKSSRGSVNAEIKHLMVRPSFPHVYRESEMPDITSISEVIVVVNDAWKVGDLVDWWTDGCYWSGKITELRGEEKCMVLLPPPPVGEGGHAYSVSCNDLRPSLDWSPDVGWAIPDLKNGAHVHCARLVKPLTQGSYAKTSQALSRDAQKHGWTIDGTSHNNDVSSPSSVSPSLLQPPEKSACISKQPHTASLKEIYMSENTRLDVDDSGTRKNSCAHGVSSSHVRDVKVEVDEATTEERSSNKRPDGGIALNIMSSNTIEAAILDLEELVNRVKWIKSILEFENPLSDTARPAWKFMQHRASSTSK